MKPTYTLGTLDYVLVTLYEERDALIKRLDAINYHLTGAEARLKQDDLADAQYHLTRASDMLRVRP